MDIKLTEHGKSVDFVHAELNRVDQNQKLTASNQAGLLKTVELQQCSINNLRDYTNQLERRSRERNLRLVGYKESESEQPLEAVKNLLRDKFGIVDPQVETAHRIGRKDTTTNGRKPRHLIFRVATTDIKFDILNRKRTVLQDEEFFITEDMTQKGPRTKD